MARRDATDHGPVRRNGVYSRRAVIGPDRLILTHRDICNHSDRDLNAYGCATLAALFAKRLAADK